MPTLHTVNDVYHHRGEQITGNGSSGVTCRDTAMPCPYLLESFKIYNQSLSTDTLEELRGCSTQL